MNLLDSMKLLFRIQQGCVMPFKVNRNRLEPSFWLTIYGIGMVIFYLIAVAINIAIFFRDGTHLDCFKFGYLWGIIAIFEFSFTNLNPPLIIVYLSMIKDTQMKSINKILALDELIENEFNVKLENLHKSAQIHTNRAILVYFIYYLCIFVGNLYWLHEYELTQPGIILFAILYQAEQLGMGLFSLSCVHFLILIKSRFQLLKFILSKFDLTDLKPLKFESRKLSKLLFAFKELCDLLNVNSGGIGIILVIRFAHDFTLATSQCYLIFWILTNHDTIRIYLILFIAFWMLQNFMKICATGLICQITMNEVIIFIIIQLLSSGSH